ncbi:MAG: InlB B-repeat-containing protein [Clostridiales bacterium]|nr:InlB B-repeat-containing protein [Clostridiales bacterium]
MKRGRYQLLTLFLACALLLTSCASGAAAQTVLTCPVVLEEAEGYTAERYTAAPLKGEDAVFALELEDGYILTGTDYADTEIVQSGRTVTLTLHSVRYSTAVTLYLEQEGETVYYDANGGTRLDGGDASEPVEVVTATTHLRWNTSTGVELFQREGYTLIGWNTQADGSGTAVGLGSRVDPSDNLTLYAQWSKWTDECCFTWEAEGDGVRITGYSGTDSTISVPAELDGLPVRYIGAGAFAGAVCDTVILPNTVQTLESGAFQGCTLSALYLSDNLITFSDYSFQDCDNLKTVHLNAVEEPVYSGTYYDTFTDKFDRLLTLADSQKIVLFSGSSTRFGYDSAAIDQAFEGYEVVNMGVFAYTNAYPQLLLILGCMGEGDILIHAPEFDAAQRQFCTTSRMDDTFFKLIESNYDLLARLDLREVGGTFSALSSFLSGRKGMEAGSYARSASDYDEDGNPVDEPSYNEYGDYILYRPNADSDEPIYGLEVDYTVKSFPVAQFIQPLNEMYQRFLDRGVRVYFTYAPRNSLAISEDSTEEARAELDAWFRENLLVPVLSDIEESLWPGRYLYGTDNHLSTEGVAIRTEQIISELKEQLAKEGAE